MVVPAGHMVMVELEVVAEEVDLANLMEQVDMTAPMVPLLSDGHQTEKEEEYTKKQLKNFILFNSRKKQQLKKLHCPIQIFIDQIV